MDPENTADSGMDMDAAVGEIASGLGIELSDEAPEVEETEELDAAPQEETEAVEPEAAAAPVVTHEMPKSWLKDKAEVWAKMLPDAQEYYIHREKQMLDGLEMYKTDATFAKELREVTSPYKAFLTSQGATEKEAVGMLLNAHYKLSTGTAEERAAYYRQIGVEMGITQPVAGQNQPPLDPVLQNLQNELQSVKSALTARQQAELRDAQATADREIEAFQADPANAYFDDVVQDMIHLVKSGISLKDAYDKAVWANPVTRQKELNRIQTESEAQFKQSAKTQAETARKATSSNVRGAESRKAPTEPKGEMFADMPDILANIRKKSH